jgi:hypothetical protein
MAKMRKKSELPTKTCRHCGRSFAWRKKWQRCWDEVLHCSKRCRSDYGRRLDISGAKRSPALPEKKTVGND